MLPSPAPFSSFDLPRRALRVRLKSLSKWYPREQIFFQSFRHVLSPPRFNVSFPFFVVLSGELPLLISCCFSGRPLHSED